MELCGNFTKYFPVSSDFFDSVDRDKWYHSQWNGEGKSVQVHAIGYHVNKNNEGTLCESTIFFCFWERVICWNFFLVVAKIGRCGLSAARVNGLKYMVHEIYNTWPKICLQSNSLHNDFMTISRVQWCLTCKYHRTISLSYGKAGLLSVSICDNHPICLLDHNHYNTCSFKNIQSGSVRICERD